MTASRMSGEGDLVALARMQREYEHTDPNISPDEFLAYSRSMLLCLVRMNEEAGNTRLARALRNALAEATLPK